MLRFLAVFSVVVLFSLVPIVSFGAGAHDGLECTGCHALHTAKDGGLLFAVDANKKDVNPKTKQAYSGIAALCLGCHESPEKGGQGIKPIAGHESPYGISSINAKIARVPRTCFGTEEIRVCHATIRIRPIRNCRYLRVDTSNGAKMELFCAACHCSKADPKTAGPRKHTCSAAWMNAVRDIRWQ